MNVSNELVLLGAFGWLLALSAFVLRLHVRAATHEDLLNLRESISELQSELSEMRQSQARVDERTQSMQQQMMVIYEQLRVNK